MKPALILILLLVAWAESSPAQSFYRGEYVLASGDTLEGEISRYRGAYLYREGPQKEVQALEGKEVVSYRIGQYEYHKMRLLVRMNRFPEYREAFARILVDGPLRLIYYQGEDVYGNLWENYFLQAQGADPILVPSKPQKFRKDLRKRFERYPELSDKIDRRELTFEDLEEIVKSWNAWTEEQS